MKAINVIADVKLKDSNITIRLAEPSNGKIYWQRIKKVFGYSINIDSTVSSKEIFLIQDGVREK